MKSLCVGLLIEEHISLSILDAGFRHLGHTLVIKFIPQIVDIIPAVGYVVATWDQTGECVRAAFVNLTSACDIFLRANECRTLLCANWRRMHQSEQKEEGICPLTAGSAVVTDDWQQVIVGGLGGAVFGQKGLQVQALKREGDVGAYLGGEHQFVSEALQVDTQDLEQRNASFILEIWCVKTLGKKIFVSS